MRFLALAVFAAELTAGCNTVALGDNFVPPEIILDEDFFVCQIQPNVLTMHHCATGTGMGGCHSSRSALQLRAAAETDPQPRCDAMNLPLDPVPPSFRDNFHIVQPFVRATSISSPLYNRPLGEAHPVVLYDDMSPEAALMAMWIDMGVP